MENGEYTIRYGLAPTMDRLRPIWGGRGLYSDNLNWSKTQTDIFFNAFRLCCGKFPSVDITAQSFQSCKNGNGRLLSRPMAKKNPEEPKLIPKIDGKNLIQLLLMGAGAPGLGEFKEIDKDGKAIFELEANNFMDAQGNDLQTKQKYFKEGWVEDEGLKGAPGFWANLLSGGRLQSEWEESLNRNN
eukprot:gene7187-14651_t